MKFSKIHRNVKQKLKSKMKTPKKTMIKSLKNHKDMNNQIHFKIILMKK